VEVLHRLDAMDAVQLAASLLALARCRQPPPPGFMEAFWQRSGQLLAATAAAHGGRGRGSRQGPRVAPAVGHSSSDDAAAATAGPAVASVVLFNPQALANMLGALAMLGAAAPPPSSWRDACLDAARALLPRFRGRDCAYFMWGLAVLRVQPPRAWTEAFLLAVRREAGSMSAQQLSAVVWALAHARHRPRAALMRRFLELVAAAPQQQHPSHGAAAAADVLRGAGTDGGQGAAAPPTPLQLSGYFSAIILQGLTAWAATHLLEPPAQQQLEGGPGLHQHHAAGAGASPSAVVERRRRGRPRRTANSCDGAEPAAGASAAAAAAAAASAEQEPAAAEAASAAGAVTPHSTSVALDGSIVYHF
jgi:hypothetical protein